MPGFHAYAESVEWVWLAWAGSVVAVVLLLVRTVRGFTAADARRLARDESGAAYSLAYVLTAPVYVIFVCTVVETTMILVAKIGTVNAAYAATRCYVVYHGPDLNADEDAASGCPPLPPQADDRRVHATELARLAGVRAMVPFASPSRFHADGPTWPPDLIGTDAYTEAARQYAGRAGTPVNAAVIRAKYRYAYKAVGPVEVSKPEREPKERPVKLTLVYRAPLHIPVVARLMGDRSPWGGRYRVLEIRTTVSLPDELPLSDDCRLGIRHDPPR